MDGADEALASPKLIDNINAASRMSAQYGWHEQACGKIAARRLELRHQHGLRESQCVHWLFQYFARRAPSIMAASS